MFEIKFDTWKVGFVLSRIEPLISIYISKKLKVFQNDFRSSSWLKVLSCTMKTESNILLSNSLGFQISLINQLI